MTPTAAFNRPAASIVFAPAQITAGVAVAASAPDDVFGAYALLGEIGPVTAAEFARVLRIDKGYARTWLKWQSQLDYVHRDEFGRFATFCPIPRPLY